MAYASMEGVVTKEQDMGAVAPREYELPLSLRSGILKNESKE